MPDLESKLAPEMTNPNEIALVILESHPVQYHAPVYRELAKQCPGRTLVLYASDCSVRGHTDPGFGRVVAWDVPLLEGYPHRVLHAERGEGLHGFRSLRGNQMPGLLRRLRPRAVLFGQLAYEFEWAAYLTCLVLRIPMWLRTETQDAAFERGWLKSAVRSVAYRVAYAGFARFFCIGELNRRHYLAHGVPVRKLTYARYGVPDRLAGVSETDKRRRRSELRAQLRIDDTSEVVAFFGKLIPKKDPMILLEGWNLLPAERRRRVRILYVGDGELKESLWVRAEALGAATIFAGFINQSQLTDYYLAADVAVLPSRRMGETWGLVVNEALLAGCGVVVSEAVGCAVEFNGLPRVITVPVGSAAAVAAALAGLLDLPREFEWARPALDDYTIDRAAAGIAAEIDLKGPQ
jgi:glycosyltransferase involved in cell wall biosynthesis